jgi:carbon-monoxide dehydrogenase small subunit
MGMVDVKFKVNGKDYKLQVNENETLLTTLRERLNLTGVKEGCGKGECGACSVILNDRPVNSCLILTAQLDGADILTVEGVTQKVIIDSFLEAGAIQCGFCTPGFIISTYSLLKRNLSPSKQEIKKALEGNLCRCTGYKKIIEAVELAAQRLRKEQGE